MGKSLGKLIASFMTELWWTVKLVFSYMEFMDKCNI
jgi:hypothetical protein